LAPKIAEVIEHDVCTACGACEAVCPVGAVTVDKTAEIRDPNDLTLYTHGAAPKVCEGCFTCGRVCPVVDGYVEDEFANVKRFFGAKSQLPGQDGAVTSAILKSLFEQGEIDCAVGIAMNEKWETEVIVLTQASDVDKTKGTKYTSDPVDAILRDLFQKYDRIAVAGVPCQVHAARLIDENVNDKIVLILGLLCMESFHHDKMQEEIIPNILGLNIEDVTKMDFGGGKFWAYTKDGEAHNVPISAVASLARNPCHNCCDYTSVHADISLGSVGTPDGWNSVLIRTDKGEKYFNMVKGLEIMEDPKPGMFLIKKLADMKHKNNSEHYLEVCEKFSFSECGIR